MSEIALTNSNMLVETHIPSEGRDARRQRWGAARGPQPPAPPPTRTPPANSPRPAGQVAQIVCSAVWEEDCLYRGKDYAPDFACTCGLCRTEFPKRLYPRRVSPVANFPRTARSNAKKTPNSPRNSPASATTAAAPAASSFPAAAKIAEPAPPTAQRCRVH